MELEGYSRPTCNKLCAVTDDTLHCCRCNPYARPSTSWPHHRQSLGQSSRGKCPYFWRYLNFLTTQFRTRERKLPCQNQPDLSSCLDTILTCDRQTHDNSIYHASVASLGKNGPHISKSGTVVCKTSTSEKYFSLQLSPAINTRFQSQLSYVDPATGLLATMHNTDDGNMQDLQTAYNCLTFLPYTQSALFLINLSAFPHREIF